MNPGEGNARHAHSHKKGGKEETLFPCICKGKGGEREVKPRPDCEWFYNLGSKVPQIILIGIIIYIYFCVMSYYVVPLMTGKYKLENFDSNGLDKLFMQTGLEDIPNQSFLIMMASWHNKIFSFSADKEHQDEKTKGFILFSVLNVLLIFLIWSIYKTSTTSPGGVPDSTNWIEEINQFMQSLKDQEMGFIQAFEQKYSLTYLRNQRQSKTIPVDERAIEKQTDEGQQFQQVFSEKNSDSDRSIDAQVRNLPLKPIKEMQRESLEVESMKGKEEQLEIALSSHGEDQSMRSESEVVFEERVLEGTGEEAATAMAQVVQFFSEKTPRETNESGAVYDQEEYERLLQQLYRMHVEQEIERHNYRPCKKCYNIIKPQRTHHCTQCKKCVLKMDHHCQWVDNCIGFKNYKYFLNMLFYSSIALTFCTLVFVKCYLDACVTEKLSERKFFEIALAFFFIATMNFFIFSFTLFHFWLTIQNKTTIEFCEKKSDSHSYSIGCWKNFKAAYGNNVLTWFFPLKPKLEGDGAYFPTSEGYQACN